MERTSKYWIEKLKLQPHPEGGYFSETWRSVENVELPGGIRSCGTAIFFLLKGNQFSSFHRLKSDEVWHFYDGTGLVLYTIEPDGILQKYQLGLDFEKGEMPQLIVKATRWFAAKPNDDKGFSLVGCTMSPGFDFADFELGRRSALIQQFPQHKEIIRALTL